MSHTQTDGRMHGRTSSLLGLLSEPKRQCTYCDYKVSKNSSLREHIKSVHEGIKYPCDQCEYVAKIKRSLKKHVKNKHSKVQ